MNKPYVCCVGYTGAHEKPAQIFADAHGLGYQFVGIRSEWWTDANAVKNAAFVFVWNGLQYHAPLAVELCRRQGIPFVVYEQGFLPQDGTFMFDPAGFNARSSLNGSLSWVTDDHLDDLADERERLQQAYPLNPQGHVLAVLQIHNDTQVLYNTPYTTMDDFIEDLAALYPSQSVVIRPHPKSNAHRIERGRHQRIVAGGDFLAAAAEASVVVGLTSTCLIEAAILGVPVVALGDHPMRLRARRDHDRLAAAFLARRLCRTCREVPDLVASMGLAPLIRRSP